MTTATQKALVFSAVFAAGFAAASLLFWQPPEAVDAVDESQVLARMGDEVITIAEFQQEMARRGGQLPDQFHSLEQKRELLDALVDYRRQLAAARAAGFHQDPEVLRVSDRAAISKFYDDEMEAALAKATVTDEDVQAWYQSNQDDYAIPARYRVALILLPSPGDDSPQAWTRLRDLAAEIQDRVPDLGPDVRHFGDLAREFSAHRASRYNGGAVAWLVQHPGKRHPWDPAVVEAAFALSSPGELAPPVETADGIFLLRLMALEPARPRPFEKVADGIRYHLERTRRHQAKEALLARLTQNSKVEIYDDRLEQVEPLNPQTADPRKTPPALPKS
ncbi:MAG: peptidyl-prolyl cis-trans isomerase [Xanthomonadales bacterium]|nr:peptidyl-prolyl cis-trans isomerase [Xanthomonadales bacterium]